MKTPENKLRHVATMPRRSRGELRAYQEYDVACCKEVAKTVGGLRVLCFSHFPSPILSFSLFVSSFMSFWSYLSICPPFHCSSPLMCVCVCVSHNCSQKVYGFKEPFAAKTHAIFGRARLPGYMQTLVFTQFSKL